MWKMLASHTAIRDCNGILNWENDEQGGFEAVSARCYNVIQAFKLVVTLFSFKYLSIFTMTMDSLAGI